MNTLSILNTVSARQLQRDYKSIFANVNKTNTPIMVISNNEPQVVILSIKEMDNINKFFSEQKLWEEKKFTIITSQPIVEEFTSVISRLKFKSNYKISPRSVQLLTKMLIEHQIKIPIPRASIKVRDPKDVVVLAAALQGH